MKKLFAALRKLHPGYEVVDVRFTASAEKTDKTVDQLDEELAYAVLNSTPVDIEALCRDSKGFSQDRLALNQDMLALNQDRMRVCSL